MTRLAFIALVSIGGAACGSSTPAPTAPTPIPAVITPPAQSDSVAMSGTVSDAAFRSVADVRVEVLDGPQAGMMTTTNSRGQFSFSGVFDDQTRFQATKDGYATSIRVLQPFCAACHPNRWINFTLDAVGGSVDMSGDYLVTLNAACSELPNEVRTRTYTASVSAAQRQTVALRGATFVKGWDTLSMGIVSDYVAFWIEVLVEQIAPNVFLTVNALSATHVGTVPGATFTLPIEGSIDYCVTTPDAATDEDCYRGRAVKNLHCASGQLVFTRR